MSEEVSVEEVTANVALCFEILRNVDNCANETSLLSIHERIAQCLAVRRNEIVKKTLTDLSHHSTDSIIPDLPSDVIRLLSEFEYSFEYHTCLEILRFQRGADSHQSDGAQRNSKAGILSPASGVTNTRQRRYYRTSADLKPSKPNASQNQRFLAMFFEYCIGFDTLFNIQSVLQYCNPILYSIIFICVIYNALIVALSKIECQTDDNRYSAVIIGFICQLLCVIQLISLGIQSVVAQILDKRDLIRLDICDSLYVQYAKYKWTLNQMEINKRREVSEQSIVSNIHKRASSATVIRRRTTVQSTHPQSPQLNLRNTVKPKWGGTTMRSRLMRRSYSVGSEEEINYLLDTSDSVTVSILEDFYMCLFGYIRMLILYRFAKQLLHSPLQFMNSGVLPLCMVENWSYHLNGFSFIAINRRCFYYGYLPTIITLIIIFSIQRLQLYHYCVLVILIHFVWNTIICYDFSHFWITELSRESVKTNPVFRHFEHCDDTFLWLFGSTISAIMRSDGLDRIVNQISIFGVTVALIHGCLYALSLKLFVFTIAMDIVFIFSLLRKVCAWYALKPFCKVGI